MPNVWSVLLWDHAESVAGDYYSGIVPAGFVWDVREISLICNNTANTFVYALEGCWVMSKLTGRVIYRVPWAEARKSAHFHWEGRQILNAGDALHLYDPDGNWQLRACGYQLTLP